MTNRRSQNSGTPRSLEGVTIASADEAGVSDAELCAFYSENWDRPIALAREDFLGWQFSAPPDAAGRNHSVVAKAEGKIIAVLGAAPRPFVSNGQVQKAAELTTWIVAPEARGRGIGGAILGFLQDRYEVLMGAGITAQALPIYLKAEFTFLAHVPRFFFVGRFDRLGMFAKPHPAALAAVEQRQDMANPVRFHAQPCSAQHLGDVLETPAGADSQSLRSSRYLRWRYDNHPVFSYQGYLVADGPEAAPRAGVILRQDEVNGVPFLHLVDVLGAPEGYTAAVAFLEEEARKRGCAFVDASATSGRLNVIFRARGWNSAVDDPLIALPSLFYPVEFRNPPTTSLVFWSRDQKNSLYDFSRLHFTKGDLDLDRPTLDFYEKHGR